MSLVVTSFIWLDPGAFISISIVSEKYENIESEIHQYTDVWIYEFRKILNLCKFVELIEIIIN